MPTSSFRTLGRTKYIFDPFRRNEKDYKIYVPCSQELQILNKLVLVLIFHCYMMSHNN